MPGPVFLRGDRVDLRVLDKATGLEACWRWINDPRVRKFLTPFFPVSREEEEEFFTKPQPDSATLAIVARDQKDRFIGTIGFSKIHRFHRTAITGTMIGEVDCWGKGYGTEAKMLLLRYGFDTLNLRKVNSEAIAFNQRSINYSLACGYRIEGRLKQEVFRDGRYWDLVRLAVFRPQFERAWAAYQKKSKKK